uniref:uncharacterized protein LOC117611057 n=1 Tax=Osmia lignaria TaxID=473952 RepID=UPI0014795078|nr:uncharacterized protein LOC117611057 [Osmia lignaria]
MTEPFWTARGLNQGCPLSPLLYNLLTADLEEEMQEGGIGGIKLGEKKIYTLAYADDVALLAEKEEDMTAMLRRLERYLDRKKLQLNREKSKVMRFRKGGGRWKKRDWTWKGKKTEEVKSFKYLEYIFRRNGGNEMHIKDRVGKASVVMRQVWWIGKRRFGKDWRRRIWLWDRLAWSTTAYGVEVWGWNEWRETEGLPERYLRWTLGEDWCTPGYMLREELQRSKMRDKAGKLAWGYERKMWRKRRRIGKEMLGENDKRRAKGIGKKQVGREEETWEHVWEGCGVSEERKEGWQEKVKELLGEDGEGELWMKEAEKGRTEGEDEVEVENGGIDNTDSNSQ